MNAQRTQPRQLWRLGVSFIEVWIYPNTRSCKVNHSLHNVLHAHFEEIRGSNLYNRSPHRPHAYIGLVREYVMRGHQE